ncbi:MAG: SOS response-associated peptidase [Bacteroidetes bacterium]|nr:SOS response-associated peptidase [Bacteroidota bacterium]
MCYHKSNNFTPDELQTRYGAPTDAAWSERWRAEPHYHENGFDHLLSPVLTKDGFGYFSWGLIPWYTKPEQSLIIRNQTLNCISEEMFDKPSFRDSLKDGKRCLVPMTGFYEWKWLDSKGKEKLPYYIYLKDQKIFSAAGLYSTWHDKANDTTVHTYTILTTIANPLMTEIHNMKKRMPVIMPREFEKDWLNPTLTKDDVLALCQPLDNAKMDAHPISKRITSKKDSTNVPEVMAKVESGLLF